MAECLDLRHIPPQKAQEIINYTLKSYGVQQLTALVDDDQTAAGLAKQIGGSDYRVQTGEQGGDYYLNIHKNYVKTQLGQEVNYVLLISSLSLGQGDKALGNKLLIGLLESIAQIDVIPSHLVLINEAVNMVINPANGLPALEHLAALGCEILVSADSVDYYTQQSQLALGYAITNVHLAALLAQAGKVVTL